MLIRPATYTDIETIAHYNALMALETEHKTLDMPTVITAVKAALNDPAKGFYLVAEENSQVVGNLMVTYEWSDWRNCNMWWIQSVYVNADFRRKGVYRALYEETRRRAKDAGARIIRLYVEKQNITAQKTYESLGMKEGNYLMYEVDI
ncbi:MAG TPA: GNAT family N-acetyltransferase [Bacteroidia bacterium]|nr:GNAT family N-acetyltransferase [Bacteroidia bacterium]